MAEQATEFKPISAQIMIFNQDGTIRAKGISPEQTEFLEKQLVSPNRNSNNGKLIESD